MKIIKLYADWCGPCKVLEQRMQELDVNYTNVNIESSEGEYYTDTYEVAAVPTILTFDEFDNLINKISGVPATMEDLKKIIYNE